ncbi:MAG: hypothetical protein JO096_09635 [Alphaproteobacteria bacterium]|nr:hypothetical protein [Alphaproteobacteria bacterium]
MVSVLVPSRDAAPRQDIAGSKGAPHAVSGAAAPMLQRDGLSVSVVGSPASPIGNLLYLGSVGLVAAGIITVFFGTGFSLLAPSARGIPPISTVRAGLEAIVLQPPVRTTDQAPLTDGTENLRNSAVLAPSGEGSALSSDSGLGSQARAEASVPPTPDRRPAAAAAAGVPAPDATAAITLAQPSSASPAAERRELLQHGDSLLRTGDVASARLFYERAAAAGDGWAALRLGATFDPAFLERLGLGKFQSDPASARSWYSRAVELGVMEAKRQLNGLETRQGK